MIPPGRGITPRQIPRGKATDEPINNPGTPDPNAAPASAPEAPADNSDHAQWQEDWKQKLAEVDDHLVAFFKEAGETGHDLGEKAQAKVQELLDKTDMDEKAKANWEKAKADGKLFGAQVENRITHLVENGKIKWAEWTKKG